MMVMGVGWDLGAFGLEVCFFIYIFPSSSVDFPYSVPLGRPFVGSDLQYKSLASPPWVAPMPDDVASQKVNTGTANRLGGTETARPVPSRRLFTLGPPWEFGRCCGGDGMHNDDRTMPLRPPDSPHLKDEPRHGVNLPLPAPKIP